MAEPHRSRFVVVTTDEDADFKAYLKANQLVPDEVAFVSPIDTKFRLTPTIVLVGRDGVVRAAWVGRLPQKGEFEVLREIQTH